ncbi:hypothetical protein FSP39_013612 [Pinctada imbricata]|uniref:cyclin-dependent kinase n=1 Tax=Pinctada imbricata TaxID=66713 RepID=A0AA88YJA4_PINIB|nr:hypothetical protein FSP39_013612 [Pinctada imbricata]
MCSRGSMRSFKSDNSRMNINLHTTIHHHHTHYLDGTNSTVHHRKVLHLNKLDKKRPLSQSLSWINRIKQRLWGRDGPHADQGPEGDKKKKTPVKEEPKDHKCSTLPRNARLGIVHENPKILSDGESEEISGTSSEREDYVSPVKLRNRPRRTAEEVTKRLSLPADMRLPGHFLTRASLSPEGMLSRRSRRKSLSEIGFGKIESYTKLDKLGEGTYATVFKGKSRLTDNLVALKEIRLEHDEGAPCTAIREVSLLRELKHANIVTLHDIIHTEKSLTLVFEYLEKDLKQYMDDCGNIMSMTNVKVYVGYTVGNAVIPLGLVPDGITYRPPDVLLGSTEYSTQIDMWGVGCIFYEMACGRPLFPGSTVEDELHYIFKILGTPTEETFPGISKNEEFLSYKFPNYEAENLINVAPRLDGDGLDLLSHLLLFEARKRSSASEGMRHAFFNSFGPSVHRLPDTVSVFTIPGIVLHKDPGMRSSSLASSGKVAITGLLLLSL